MGQVHVSIMVDFKPCLQYDNPGLGVQGVYIEVVPALEMFHGIF